MGSLCIREMTGHRAAAHSGGGFRHGPILDVDGSHVAIIFALGRRPSLGVEFAHDCHARGGKVILVGTEDRQNQEQQSRRDSFDNDRCSPGAVGRNYLRDRATSVDAGHGGKVWSEVTSAFSVWSHEGVSRWLIWAA